ncbi:phenylalanine ammonia-lyase [Sistotremastrum niveocremeum HHB9708]|uniref:Phenylalanine ammonia-lyase n=2 Tax=Sistotremastraceae TaxID=3402574 RepID=A0A164UZF2_9AGAM|nr:phenylalanine ammonia-lyase [Sistotremastrum niveocremeum HHB9708]KZT37834.1 phenylalanine ammonia-lyase [Sistotremastrum suecicum HHB10207 ss-3]
MHLDTVRRCWTRSSDHRSDSPQVILTGSDLDIAAVVAVARYNVSSFLTEDFQIRKKVDEAVAFVLAKSDGPGANMYGVNTGVGARGTITRTNQRTELQRTILKHLACGVLPSAIVPSHNPTFDPSTLVFPEAWIRAAILVRINALLRGHSGCRWELLHGLHQLLVNDIIPCVPLRQTISASGDLAPLGYIAATLSSEMHVRVWCGKGNERKQMPASQALALHGVQSLEYGPKEALAVVNGTAPSCAVAALAVHDSNILAIVAQVCTAMSVEALTGTPESFDSFMSDIARPHPGQIEVARNCRAMIKDSKLTRYHDESDPTQTLRQDRYSLRTSPQWIGPHLEELVTGMKTLETEMNSTTDNPIIDVQGDRTLHGGNFQATSVAMVMEKTRIALQHFGKIAYAQFTELNNTNMNRGLPPDLCAWEPSIDFGTKAMDVATAAYLSELSFVSNTVTNHVQSAEMHNQAINSLAMISARYTYTAIQCLQMIYANHIWALCQAVDLRVLTELFFAQMKIDIATSFRSSFPDEPEALVSELTRTVFNQARVSFGNTTHLDSKDRFTTLVRSLLAEVTAFLEDKPAPRIHFDIYIWQRNLAKTLLESFRVTRSDFYEHGTAAPLLGSTVSLYHFVRKTLQIPFRKGSTFDDEEIDAQVSRIYASFDSGDIVPVLLDVLASAQ